MPKLKSYWDTKERVDDYLRELTETEDYYGLVDMVAKLVDTGYPLRYDRLIDLGCGPGNAAAEVIKRFPFKNLLAIDLSEAMLDEVPWFIDIEKTRTTMQCDDLATCTFKAQDQSTDLIISRAALTYLPSVQNVFTESARVLKRNGILTFSLIVHTENTDASIPWSEDLCAMGTYAHSKRWITDASATLQLSPLVPFQPIDIGELTKPGFEYGLFMLSKR